MSIFKHTSSAADKDKDSWEDAEGELEWPDSSGLAFPSTHSTHLEQLTDHRLHLFQLNRAWSFYWGRGYFEYSAVKIYIAV